LKQEALDVVMWSAQSQSMKTFRVRALIILVLLTAMISVVRAADTNLPPRLAIELRDGSRVVGTCADADIKFRSTLLGEIKLNIKDIRSMECTSTNSAKLITTDGNTLIVWFVNSPIAIKTSFGEVALAVDSVRKFSVSGNDSAQAKLAEVSPARAAAYANTCINNLRQIDAALNQFALEAGKRTGDPVHFPNDLTPYIRLNSKGEIPGCPEGGTYSVIRVGDTPTCSLSNTVAPVHVLP
jgi:hypothetical protein